MTEIFKMPDIGEGMAEGDITAWLVKVGDTVAMDDPVAEVQNDKLIQEILSPYAGKVTKLFVPAETTVSVGDPLIEFDGDGSGTAPVAATAAPVSAPEVPSVAPAPEQTPQAQPTPEPASNTVQTANGHVLAMPSVRHLAFEKGIDLTQVPATGRHGHVTLADAMNFPPVETPVAAPAEPTPPTPADNKPQPPVAPAPVHEGRQPMTPVRKAAGKRPWPIRMRQFRP